MRNISLSGCADGFLCWSGREDWASWFVFGGTARVFAKPVVYQEQGGPHTIITSSLSTGCGITGLLTSVQLLQVMDQSQYKKKYKQ